MADNFLENHYEEYLRRKQRWENKKSARAKQKKSHLPKGFVPKPENQ
ncbi:MAG: dehydrogenase [Bacteroidaceae bacterium]|nr:dehydrogenase [Bacteroidaceae bacterium]